MLKGKSTWPPEVSGIGGQISQNISNLGLSQLPSKGKAHLQILLQHRRQVRGGEGTGDRVWVPPSAGSGSCCQGRPSHQGKEASRWEETPTHPHLKGPTPVSPASLPFHLHPHQKSPQVSLTLIPLYPSNLTQTPTLAPSPPGPPTGPPGAPSL